MMDLVGCFGHNVGGMLGRPGTSRCFPEAGLGGSTEASTGGSSKGVQVAPCS